MQALFILHFTDQQFTQINWTANEGSPFQITLHCRLPMRGLKTGYSVHFRQSMNKGYIRKSMNKTYLR